MENLSQAAARLQEVKTEERNLSNQIDDFEVSFNGFYMSVNLVKKSQYEVLLAIAVKYTSEKNISKIFFSAYLFSVILFVF